MLALFSGAYAYLLGHTKLIPCSTEHQGTEVGSVGRKENKLNMLPFPVITSSCDIKVTVLKRGTSSK